MVRVTARASLALGLVLVLADRSGAAGESQARAPAPSTVSLTVHVASVAGAPVVSEQWVKDATERAGRLLARGQVAFVVSRIEPLSAGDVVTVDQRNDLIATVPRDGTVHVFVVPKLADKDVPAKWLNGVHWRYSGGSKRLRGRRGIIMAATSHENTLPHELGHYFGLSHAKEPGNLMSYDHSVPVFITEKQARRIKRRLRWALKRRRLIPPPPS